MIRGQEPAKQAVNYLSLISEFHFAYYRYHFPPQTLLVRRLMEFAQILLCLSLVVV